MLTVAMVFGEKSKESIQNAKRAMILRWVNTNSQSSKKKAYDREVKKTKRERP